MAVVPMRKSDIASFEPVLDKEGLLGFARLVPGGIHRQDSVYSGFQEVDPHTDVVVVHDAVRPFVELESIDAVIAEKEEFAILPLRDDDRYVQWILGDGDELRVEVSSNEVLEAPLVRERVRATLGEDRQGLLREVLGLVRG